MATMKATAILWAALITATATSSIPAIADAGAVSAVTAPSAARADQPTVSLDLPKTTIKRGEIVTFRAYTAMHSGTFDGFFREEWTVPDGVVVDYPYLSEPVWPPVDRYHLIVGPYAELGETEIVVNGVVHSKAGEKYPVQASATITIVEGDGDEQPGNHGYSASFEDTPVRVAPGGTAQTVATGASRSGGGAVIQSMKFSPPAGISVKHEKVADSWKSPYNVVVTADENLAPGDYLVNVTAQVSDSRGGEGFRWFGTMPVKVTGGGGVDPTPVVECSAQDEAGVRISQWWPTMRRVQVSGCDRVPSSTSVVSVSMDHGRPGDVQLTLVGPGGRRFVLRQAGDDSAADASYTVDLSGEKANGVWQLHAVDKRWGVNGTLTSWSITL